eukprot:5754206-Pleurochrysis_carterae.AAC.2
MAYADKDNHINTLSAYAEGSDLSVATAHTTLRTREPEGRWLEPPAWHAVLADFEAKIFRSSSDAMLTKLLYNIRS